MQLPVHTATDYADAQRALLPPGAAWDWPQGGFGAALLGGMGEELARIGADAQLVLDAAPELHRPKHTRWTLADYRQVANDAIAGVTETLPRRTFAVGSHAGNRLWSAAGNTIWTVPLVQVDHLIGPLRVGSKAGQCMWSTRSRYILRVRYYQSVVDTAVLWQALSAFKQAHVFLWFEDITGAGGYYASN